MQLSLKRAVTTSRMFSLLLLLAESVLGVVTWLPRALLSWLRDWLHFRKLANRFPGPPTRPIVGSLLEKGFPPDVMTLMNWLLEDVMQRYPACQVWFGPLRFILLSDERDIQKFLTNSKNQSKANLMINFGTYILGKGLLTTNGDEWRLHNKIINPAFHLKLLNAYVSVFNRKTDVFVEHLSHHANGEVFDVQEMVEKFAIDNVFETLLGVPSNHQAESDHTSFDFVKEGQKAMAMRLTRPWLLHRSVYNLSAQGRRANQFLNIGRDLLKSTIEKRIQILRTEAASPQSTELSDALETRSTHDASSKKKPKILIDAVLQECGQSISDGEGLDELLTFFLAGHNTLSICVQYSLYYLAKNPMVQEMVMMELRKIFNPTGSTEVTPDTLQHMPYMEMFLKETIRMHPPAVLFLRTAGVDTPLESCDLVVPAGADVMISPKKMHMDPRLFPDPHVFDPERFSPENCAQRHPFAYIPFAMGLRSCIGKKYIMVALKTIISKIVWNYRVLPDETYQPELQWAITTMTTNGMKIRLVKR